MYLMQAMLCKRPLTIANLLPFVFACDSVSARLHQIPSASVAGEKTLSVLVSTFIDII